MKTYNLEFSQQELAVLDELLGNAPYRVAAPIVNNINRQIGEKQTAQDLNVTHDAIKAD